ncbi:hypothetical protein Tco_0194323 [Tanacetum coccineum]
MSKQRFASQVDMNKNLSKPVTQHYLPKTTESAFAKPDHIIASSSSRNSSKNMPRFSSNDMVHNHYIDVAKKKIQERDRNSTTSVTTSVRIQTTADDSKPKPRSNNQTSRSLLVSKSSRVKYISHVQKEQSLDLSAEVHQAAETVTTSSELDLLSCLLFRKNEYFNGKNQVVLKSSAVTTTDASNKRQQQPDSISSTSTLTTTVTANGNFDL